MKFLKTSSICPNINQENGITAKKTFPSIDVDFTATSWSSCCREGETIKEYFNCVSSGSLKICSHKSIFHSSLFVKMSKFLFVSMKAIIPANNGMTFDSKQCTANLLLRNKNKTNISMESKSFMNDYIASQLFHEH